MSNYLDNIKLIASDLANMSPKTQLEIVKLCKNLCLNVKDYLVELDETTLNNINVSIENLQIAVNNIENELDTAEDNITAIQNAIDTLSSITYTKTETNALLDAKVDKSNVGFVELSAETSTGTLTDEQYNETLKRFCIIKFGVGELFYKARNQWFTKLDYTLTEMTNYLIIKYDNIIVNNDKTWYRGESRTIQLYNTSQINTLLSNKFDSQYIGWVELDNASGTLPDSYYESTLKKYCFIKYNNDLYYKTSETASYIDFYYLKTLCDTNANDCTIYSNYIRITKSTKAYETNTTTPIHFYNTAQTDALIPHLYTLTFNMGDSYVSFLTKTKFLETSQTKFIQLDDLTAEDILFLKSLKGNLSITALIGSLSFETNYNLMGYCQDEYLYMTLNGYDIDFDLNDPQSLVISEDIVITCQQIF